MGSLLLNPYVAVAVAAYILGAGTAVYFRDAADRIYDLAAALGDWVTSFLTIVGFAAVVGWITKAKGLW